MHLFGQGEQRSAPRRKSDASAAATIEERSAKLVFKRLDLLRDRGLREQKLFRSPAETEVTRYGPEDVNAKVFDHREW